MRTRTDLDQAFALLERVADEYEPQPRTPVCGAGRRRMVMIASAAAVVALAAGVAQLSGGDTSARHDPGVGPGATTAPNRDQLRRLEFGLELNDGERITGVSVYPDGGQAARIHTTGGDVMFTVDPAAGVQRRIAPEAVTVDINGKPGYYGQGIGLTYTIPDGSASPSSSSAPAPNSPAPDSPGERAVAWQIGPDRWAVLDARSPSRISKSELLQLARGVDFTRRTAMRTPVAFDSLPPGYAVTTWSANYERAYGDPAAGAGWSALFTVALGTHEVDIDVAPRTPGNRRGVPLQVAGHRAFWTQTGGDEALYVEEGHGVGVVIANSASAMTQREAVAIATVIRVSGNAQQPSRWFDAATAIP